jgi:hypothetical protein
MNHVPDLPVEDARAMLGANAHTVDRAAGLVRGGETLVFLHAEIEDRFSGEPTGYGRLLHQRAGALARLLEDFGVPDAAERIRQAPPSGHVWFVWLDAHHAFVTPWPQQKAVSA